MSLPPPLTWLYLLPRTNVCRYDSGPAWLGELLAKSNPSPAASSSQKLLIACDRNWNDLQSSSGDYDAIAAVNSPDVTASRAAAAGFSYARELAAVPSLEAARWFIPLDSPAIAAAGFNLYTPAKVSAHLKRFAVRTAARMGLRFWQRDRVLVAARTLPPIEQLIAQLFPSQRVRLALSAGAPEPARNRKASAAVIDDRGNTIAFVKIAESDIAQRIQQREARVLAELGAWSGGREIVPHLIHAEQIDGRYVTVQTSLPGRPGPARLTSAHLRFLELLRRGPAKRASETAMVQTLTQQLNRDARAQAELITVLERVMPILEKLEIDSTIVHGDFAPWNLRLHRGSILAFDWEYGEPDGLPLIDQAHCMLQLGYLLHHWKADRGARALDEMAAARPLGMSPEQVKAIQVVYILDQLARLCGEGYSAEDEMVSWYRDVLDRIAAASARTRRPAEPVSARTSREVLT